jgi:hypothetical protein
LKYEDFEKFIREKCMYDTIYDDSDGRQVLIIRMLDAYGMVNKAQREWQGLTDEEIADMHHEIKVKGMGAYKTEDIYRAIEAKLKEKNT